MAAALVSVLLEQLDSIIHQQVQLEVKLVVDVKKEVAKLTHSFRSIEAGLKDAEERQLEEGVRRWLDRLKDVSNEVEDVLDEWNTLWLQVEKEGGNAPVGTTKMVSQCIPAPFFCSGQVSRVIFPHDIPGKIQELNERLALIVIERQNYNFQNTKSGGIEQINRSRQKTSFVDKTFGRDVEKQLLVRKLLSGSSQEGTTPLIIPIVGMGGIGKTTLAQLAYNDKAVKANFTKLIWVCVSEPFDEINIAKAIIEKLNKNDVTNSNNLQALLECVENNIRGHKFLLVLDDVWNEDDSKWEQIKLSLQNGVVGSRVLVTTRNEKVAKMMAATHNHTIHLKVLSDQHCWSIFYYKALEGRERNEIMVLEPLGEEIVQKCHGLPLVAKVLGGLMRGKTTKGAWKIILNSKIWELKVVEKNIFQPLFLSYIDLSPAIQRCLLYCVIFPKDYKINKDILIELWMSQGYISSNENKKNMVIDIGESYFDSLVTRSFFQNFEKEEFENIVYCKMHDMVHDFLQYLTKDECFIVEAKRGEEKIELPANNKFRHLTLTLAGEGPFPVCFDYNCKSLRTITTFDCKITSFGNPQLILQLKWLRTLNLSDNKLDEVPKEVWRLVHLRYLDLSRNVGLKKLPEDTLGKLVNLQTLRLVRCVRLEELPEDMGKLANLRHLHVRVCYELKLPKTIGRLTSVETLDEVNIWGDDDVIDNNKQVFKLSDLRYMNQLKGTLLIWWKKEWKDAASDADKAKLVNKKHLLRLDLYFWDSDSGRSMIQEEILSALQPNPNLESLYISSYSGTTLCPHWMKNMNHLTRLAFFDCGGCEFVPLSVLGNLGSLETLIFWEMDEVKKVEFENSTSSSSLEQVLFPSLKHLEFDYMPSWEEWSDVDQDQESDCVAMPCLSTLIIHSCDKLKALPHFLRKTQLLQELTISRCEILSESCKNRQAKEWPNISYIPNIHINGKTVQKDGVWIQKGEKMEIGSKKKKMKKMEIGPKKKKMKKIKKPTSN